MINSSTNERILVEQIFVDIFRDQLQDFVEKDNIYIQDQEKQIPNDKKIRVAVRNVDSRVVSNNTKTQCDENGVFQEVQESTVRENIQVDVFGRNSDVLFIRSRVHMALNSLFAQQQQELYNFKVYKIPSTFVNASNVEGGSQMLRFTIVVPTMVWYRLTTDNPGAGYFDKFPTKVDDDKTIETETPLAQFEINEDFTP